MDKVLVFGASGQLGQCLKTVAEKQSFKDLIFPDEQDADILNLDMLDLLFLKYRPKYIVNCAAYTAVDKAESDIDMARKINKDGPANLAQLCKRHGTTFIHVSTDFVFEGNEVKLLTEDDVANPINVYGLTKLEGEQAITAEIEKYYIVRTSWLYSQYGNNYVKTMLKLGAERGELNIIADQIGTPTYGIDLAGAILTIITADSADYGIYHYSNEGVTSWYDFAKGIFDLGGISVKVNPIHTYQYPTPAVRPKFSVMDKSKIKSTFNISIPYWRDSLIKCINILEQ